MDSDEGMEHVPGCISARFCGRPGALLSNGVWGEWLHQEGSNQSPFFDCRKNIETHRTLTHGDQVFLDWVLIAQGHATRKAHCNHQAGLSVELSIPVRMDGQETAFQGLCSDVRV